MEYKINEIKEFIFVTSDGKTRQEALEALENYLDSINMKAKGFYFIEAYNHNGVAGAMALASVDQEPERNRKFRSSVVKPGKYMMFDYPYDEFVERNKPGADNKMDLKEIIKKEGYSISGFPFFEFLPDSENQLIRVYIPLN